MSHKHTGVVTSFSVTGHDSNSAQLVFFVKSPEESQPIPFEVTTDAEARMFTSMVTILMGAYVAGMPITVEFLPVEAGINKAYTLFVPAEAEKSKPHR